MGLPSVFVFTEDDQHVFPANDLWSGMTPSIFFGYSGSTAAVFITGMPSVKPPDRDLTGLLPPDRELTGLKPPDRTLTGNKPPAHI